MIPKNPLNKGFFLFAKITALFTLKNRGTKTKKNGHFLIQECSKGLIQHLATPDR